MIEYLVQKNEQCEALAKQQMQLFEEFKRTQEHRVKEDIDRHLEGDSQQNELQSFLRSMKQLQLLQETRSDK
jgi:hypothetical protein